MSFEPFKSWRPARRPVNAAWLAVAVLAALLVGTWWLWLRSVRRWARRLRELDSAKRSQSTRYGQTMEQLAPFLAEWPGDAGRFRFLGAPIDGVQFDDDAVVFVEIKSAGSRLSPEQQRIRDLVQAGQVRWQEVRVR